MWLKGKKGDGGEGRRGNSIQVMHCRNSKLTASKVVIQKGVDFKSVKTNAAKSVCEVNIGFEVSPVGDSQANEEIERAIISVQGQV
eukprot:4321567-Pyramimonas_sp.AAC.1